MELAPGVHRFPTDPFNWYVLEEAGRLTLVDAGFPGHYSTFLAGLRSLGKTVKDVEAMVLTHAHADHMGFADRVSQAAGGAPIFIHQQDAAAAQRVLQLPWLALLSNAWRPYMAGMLARAIANGVFSTARVTRPHPFTRDGMQLDVPGRPTVIHTPGHTAGEVSLYLPSQRVLLCGDTLVTRDLYAGAHGRPQLTRPALNDDYRQARRSLDRLANLGHVQLLPGHGHPWHGDLREAAAGAAVW